MLLDELGDQLVVGSIIFLAASERVHPKVYFLRVLETLWL